MTGDTTPISDEAQWRDGDWAWFTSPHDSDATGCWMARKGPYSGKLLWTSQFGSVPIYNTPADAVLVARSAAPLLVSAEAERPRSSELGWYCAECRYWAAPWQPSGRVELSRPCPNDAHHQMFVRTPAHIERDDALAVVEGLRAELVEIRAELDLAYVEGANIGAEIGAHAAREVARNAQTVMDLLDQHGAGIVGHLLDTDNNAGQRLRSALARLAALRAAGGQGGRTEVQAKAFHAGWVAAGGQEKPTDAQPSQTAECGNCGQWFCEHHQTAPHEALSGKFRKACVGFVRRYPAAPVGGQEKRPTHGVHRREDWTPCWCAATSDHPIGAEVPVKPYQPPYEYPAPVQTSDTPLMSDEQLSRIPMRGRSPLRCLTSGTPAPSCGNCIVCLATGSST